MFYGKKIIEKEINEYIKDSAEAFFDYFQKLCTELFALQTHTVH